MINIKPKKTYFLPSSKFLSMDSEVKLGVYFDYKGGGKKKKL